MVANVLSLDRDILDCAAVLIYPRPIRRQPGYAASCDARFSKSTRVVRIRLFAETERW
jgi:hypothetical protein